MLTQQPTGGHTNCVSELAVRDAMFVPVAYSVEHLSGIALS